jgi:hypothetical protein
MVKGLLDLDAGLVVEGGRVADAAGNDDPDPTGVRLDAPFEDAGDPMDDPGPESLPR